MLSDFFAETPENLSLEIRNNRITRQQAINIIKKVGDEQPKREISNFCKYVQITEKRFFEVAEKFRNKSIWKKNIKGKFVLDGFLIDNWKW